jgi:hypothetical protein
MYIAKTGDFLITGEARVKVNNSGDNVKDDP